MLIPRGLLAAPTDQGTPVAEQVDVLVVGSGWPGCRPPWPSRRA